MAATHVSNWINSISTGQESTPSISMETLTAEVMQLANKADKKFYSSATPDEWIWRETFFGLINLCQKAQRGPSYKSDKAESILALCIKTLMSIGFLINSNLYSLTEKPIHIAAKEGCDALLTALINLGADVNAVNSLDETALHMASSNNKVSTVRLLLSNSANVNGVSNPHAITPLICGAYHPEVIRLLCQNKADVNAICQSELYGPTAIQKAAKGGYAEAVEALFEQNAMMNDIDYQEMCQAIMKSISWECQAPYDTSKVNGWVIRMQSIVKYVNVLFVLNKRQYHSFVTEKIDIHLLDHFWPQQRDNKPLEFGQVSFLTTQFKFIKDISASDGGYKDWRAITQTIKSKADLLLQTLLGYTSRVS